MHRSCSTAVLAVLIFGAGIAAAQSTPPTRTIRGIVRDDSSRRTPIPGAQVTLTRMDQNDMKVVVSNRRAKYSVETPAGTYESRGELPGFEGFENTTCPTQRTP